MGLELGRLELDFELKWVGLELGRVELDFELKWVELDFELE